MEQSANKMLNPKQALSSVDLQQGMTVADLGSGASGHFVIPAATMVGEDGVVYAVDVQKDILSGITGLASMKGLSNVKTVWSNLEIAGATKINEGSLDRALLINVLYQMKDRQTAIKEAVRLLKSGGKLLIADWVQTATQIGPPLEERVNVEGIKQLATQIGLTLEREIPFGESHFGMVFVKN